MRKKVPWMKKAENMQECVVSLDNGPLYDENFDLFYTPFQEPYRKDIVKQLQFKLEAHTLTSNKFILAGHRGVGKSTELLRVSKCCSGYKTIFVNAADARGSKGTEYTNLLVLITQKIMEFGIKSKKLDENDIAFNTLLNYWNSELEISQVTEVTKSSSGTLNTGVDINGNLSTKFSLLSKLKTIITAGAMLGVNIEKKNGQTSTVDEIIHTIIDKNDMLFVQALNDLVQVLESYMYGERLLIVIEDLDKAGQFELASDVFNTHVRAFLEIKADIIFTYPTHLQYNPEYSHIYDIFDDVFKLGVVKLISKDNSYDKEAIAAFKKLVYKRISRELIDETALETAIEMSGGLIRDMFTLLSEAAVTAGVASRERITAADVEKAVMTLEERYIKVIKIENGFDEIVKISKDSYRQVDKNLRELLRMEVVLEYSNNRYLVHPVVLRFLKQIGKEVEEYVRIP